MVNPKNGAVSVIEEATCPYQEAEKELDSVMNEFPDNKNIQFILDNGKKRIKALKNSPLMDVSKDKGLGSASDDA